MRETMLTERHIGKRVLLCCAEVVQEYTVLDLSPAKKWVKLKVEGAPITLWKKVEGLVIAEVLSTEPQPTDFIGVIESTEQEETAPILTHIAKTLDNILNLLKPSTNLPSDTSTPQATFSNQNHEITFKEFANQCLWSLWRERTETRSCRHPTVVYSDLYPTMDPYPMPKTVTCGVKICPFYDLRGRLK